MTAMLLLLIVVATVTGNRHECSDVDGYIFFGSRCLKNSADQRACAEENNLHSNLIACNASELQEANANCGGTCFACPIPSQDFDNCTTIESTNTVICTCKHDRSIQSLRCTQNGLTNATTGSHELSCYPKISLRQSKPWGSMVYYNQIRSTTASFPITYESHTTEVATSAISPWMWAMIAVIIVSVVIGVVFTVIVCRNRQEKYGVEGKE